MNTENFNKASLNCGMLLENLRAIYSQTTQEGNEFGAIIAMDLVCECQTLNKKINQLLNAAENHEN